VSTVSLGSMGRTSLSSWASGQCSTPARHDEDLAGREFDVAVPQMDGQPAAEHQKEVIGLVVPVPHEGPLHLDYLQLVVVEEADDARLIRLSSSASFAARLILSSQVSLPHVVRFLTYPHYYWPGERFLVKRH
jgi:hypothetical protein